MKQRYMVIDVALCHDCNNCFMACKDEHVGNSWLPYTDEQPRHGHRWINIHRTERGQYPRIDVAYLPVPCQHCEDAPCRKAIPEAVTRREDGVVLIDTAKAADARKLADSCPYGAIYLNEEKKVPQKCTMCAHILDSGDAPGMPRCVHSCPTGAMTFHTLEPDEMAQLVAKEGLEVLKPELNTRPHVFYKNLYRFTRHFITGGVVRDGECAEAVPVTLRGAGISQTALTDCFGEFKFDDLAPGSYEVQMMDTAPCQVSLESSCDIGDLVI